MLLQKVDTAGPLRRAFVASLGIHMLFALLVPFWMTAQSQGPPVVETLSFAHLTRVHIERHADVRRPPVALPRTKQRASTVSFARRRAELSARNRNRRKQPAAVNGPQGRVAAAPRQVTPRVPAPLVASTPGVPPPKQVTFQRAPQGSPNPQSSADRAQPGSSNSDRGGVSPFGAEQPPVLDPAVKLALLQRFTVHVTLVITVGEDGRTKSILFQPPIDPQTERAIQTMLADANWDAAVCGGGVSCEGVATIKL